MATHADWPKNIIVPDVAQYVQQRKPGLPLHKYVHHGLSSQGMLLNLVGPLIVSNHLQPLTRALTAGGISLPKTVSTGVFEYEDRSIFNEDAGQPTSIDLVAYDYDRRPSVFIEAKWSEKEFGGCSVFAAGDCDGRNPEQDFSLCYLHHIGRKYWELMDRHGFLNGPIGQGVTCIFTAYYQFFREILLALELGGVLVLLRDERNPAFQCNGPRGRRGLIPFMFSMVPGRLHSRIASITIQSLVSCIRASGQHQWIDEFEIKYGMT